MTPAPLFLALAWLLDRFWPAGERAPAPAREEKLRKAEEAVKEHFGPKEKPTPEKPTPAPTPGARWPRTAPKGGVVPTKFTGDKVAKSWRQSRYKATLDWLNTALHPKDVPMQDVAKSIAFSVLAHWDVEAASGVAEFNWNAGGIGAMKDQQHFDSVDRLSKQKMAFVAYDDFHQFVGDYFGVLAQTYPQALASLLTSPAEDKWIRELKKGGPSGTLSYYGGDANVMAKAWETRRWAILKDVAAPTIVK